MITNHIFLEIPKAVCLSVNRVPKVILKFFPTMEQKLVNAVRLRSLRMLAMPLRQLEKSAKQTLNFDKTKVRGIRTSNKNKGHI